MATAPLFDEPPDDPLDAAVALIRLRARRRDFSQAEVAGLLGYSARQTQRIFDAHGLHFRKMVCQFRCEYAADQLLAGWQVKKATLNCGYRQGQLTVPFREQFGVTPTEARRIGQLHRQLTDLRDYPPPTENVAAACRVADRWKALWREARNLQRRDLPDSPIRHRLDEAVACTPMRRPRPVPRGSRPRPRTEAPNRARRHRAGR